MGGRERTPHTYLACCLRGKQGKPSEVRGTISFDEKSINTAYWPNLPSPSIHFNLIGWRARGDWRGLEGSGGGWRGWIHSTYVQLN